MKPPSFFAVLMCCRYVTVAQNIPSGRGNSPSGKGALPVPMDMDARHYKSVVDEGADEGRILAEWKQYKKNV